MVRAAVPGQPVWPPAPGVPDVMTIDAPEVEEVTTRNVYCDGRGGALGHPRVYYYIGYKGYVDCGYCDKRFVLKGDGDDDH